MAKRRYRMTPRRRAAIKKAQAASARKRRRRAIGSTLRTAGAVAGVVGTTFATYHMNRYIAYPNQAFSDGSKAVRGIGRTVGRASGLEKRARIGAYRKHRATVQLKPRVRARKTKTDWSKFGYL